MNKFACFAEMVYKCFSFHLLGEYSDPTIHIEQRQLPAHDGKFCL